jgi:hypothetical protein
MRNQLRLNEQQLHALIAESVKNALNELDWKTYHRAYMKDQNPRRWNKFGKAADDAFNAKYGYEDPENGRSIRMAHENTPYQNTKSASLYTDDDSNPNYHSRYSTPVDSDGHDTTLYKKSKACLGDSTEEVKRPYSNDNRMARKMAAAHGEVDDYNRRDYTYDSVKDDSHFNRGPGWVNYNDMNPSKKRDWHDYLDYNN